MWIMTEEERVSSIVLSKHMQQVTDTMQQCQATLQRLNTERIIVDRRQNLWLLCFAIRNAISTDQIKHLSLSPGAGVVRPMEPKP